MMYAIHICLAAEDIDREKTTTHLGGWDLYADRGKFLEAVEERGFSFPSGASVLNDSRFRVYLSVPGRPKLTGVYYVGGWFDEGLVHLEWDDDQDHIVPRRREAILATRHKILISG